MHPQATEKPAKVPVSISIIVPCWRGDSVTEADAARWLANPCVTEVLVASPEEHGTATAHPSIRHVHCPVAGRGSQMNKAASQARGGVLLFHHADTELTPAHLLSLAEAMSDPTVGGGAFRRHFDDRHPHLRWLEPWEALRCKLFGPLFGDQSIFVRSSAFRRLGGFAEIPLMEDVEFTRRLRRYAKLAVLSPSIRTSMRKHMARGSWRTTLANAVYLGMYILGVSPVRLYCWYYRLSK